LRSLPATCPRRATPGTDPASLIFYRRGRRETQRNCSDLRFSFPRSCVGNARLRRSASRVTELRHFLAILLRVKLAVRPAPRPLDPLRIVPIPLNCLRKPALPGFAWLPLKLAFDFARINRITPVVSWSILHAFDQGSRLTSRAQDRLDNF